MASDQCTVILDGPAGSGKTTVARKVAKSLGFRFLDTGAMYRAAALAALEAGTLKEPMDEQRVVQAIKNAGLRLDERGVVTLGARNIAATIRTPEVTGCVSRVAALRAVRSLLVEQQRAFKEQATPGLVAEGRDMATVVFPGARYRFYLKAGVAARAGRRMAEMRALGLPVTDLEEMMRDIRCRDELDSGRETAPLRVATGVTVIDTTELDAAQVVKRILTAVEAGS